MQIITGRFSRRAMLIGAIASLPALAGATAAPTIRAVTMLDKPRRRSTEEWWASIEARMAELPPEVAERLRAQFNQVVERLWRLHQSGADDAEIKGCIASWRKDNLRREGAIGAAILRMREAGADHDTIMAYIRSDEAWA
ncbi:hypothetical protein [Mesorhizobium salmacidum]|uniref:Uncharacterized protein n=1 Tax=Mesorhizobium salmacidum TaxID=3015171 RepID=A0ABU8L7J5_9HYPH